MLITSKDLRPNHIYKLEINSTAGIGNNFIIVREKRSSGAKEVTLLFPNDNDEFMVLWASTFGTYIQVIGIHWEFLGWFSTSSYHQFEEVLPEDT